MLTTYSQSLKKTTYSQSLKKNNIDPDFTILINFTIEHERNGQIAFLDALRSRNNGTITTTVYRKPTHTDRYLDYNSHHDKQHKISVATTLLQRAQQIPSTTENKFNRHYESTEYPQVLLSNIRKRIERKQNDSVPSPEILAREFFELVDPIKNSHAVLPYIKGITEPITRILKKHNIRVSNKPVKTLQQEFPSPKDRPEAHKTNDVVYQIKCKDCTWSYIGETSRCYETRRKEHIRNVKTYAPCSNISKHASCNDHNIDFEDGRIIDKGNHRTRKTLESWHTANTQNADNNSKPLPDPSYILLT